MEHLDVYDDWNISSPITHTQRDLRYVLTQQCNYHCQFCHKEWCDGTEQVLLTPDDCTFLFSTAYDCLWINKVTLSGGEPMMHKEIDTIAKSLHNAWASITLVSNGALLDSNSVFMNDIHILNLSLHTTQQELYSTITWSNTNVQDLIQTIVAINKKYPHLQVKLNSAILKEQNMTNSEDFLCKIHLASTYGWKLKYLELSEDTLSWFIDITVFEQELLHMGFILDQQTDRQRFFKKDNVEIITWRVFCSDAKKTSDPEKYCKSNNDIYITPDGYISTCPMDIKKIHAYDAIVSRDTRLLSKLLQTTIDDHTHYACPFTS